MKSILSLLFIGCLAFAFVTFAKYSDGEVSVTGFNHQVELSLTVFVLLQLGLIVFSYLTIRIFSFIFSSKKRLTAFLQSRRSHKESLKLKEFIKKIITMDTSSLYRETQKYIRSNSEISEEILLISARAAHAESEYSARDECISQLEAIGGDEVFLAKALMLMDENRHHDALASLDQIKKKSAGSVKAQIRALRMGRNWEQVLLRMKDLKKFKAMDANAFHKVELESLLGVVTEPKTSLKTLIAIFKQSTKEIGQETKFVLAISEALSTHGEVSMAEGILVKQLDFSWDDDVLTLYVQISDSQGQEPLKNAERWLETQPRNAKLLIALGALCRDRELWGKSESYFRASEALFGSPEVAHELSNLYRIMGRSEESRRQLELYAERQVALDSKGSWV
jgi:HemY protein